MVTCKDCFHYEACSGFKPTDLDKDVWHYCEMGIPEEIPDIDQRCDSYKDSKSWVEVVRCKDCKYRGNDTYCPMCFDEWYEIDEGGGFYDSDFITHDRTIDEGFCDRGERRTDE